MKINIKKFYSVFAFITLCSLFINVVFADEGTVEDVLNNIVDNSEVVVHKDIFNNVESRRQYVFETKSESVSNYFNKTKNVFVIDGVEYDFEISYTDAEGDKKKFSDYNRGFNYYEETKAYGQNLKEAPINGKVTYSLVPRDPSYGTVSLDAEFKVNRNNGEIVPKEVIIENEDETNLWDVAVGLFKGDTTRLTRYITQSLCELSIPFGDSFLYMICSSIGESITIDRAVYNQVDKLSIDFFESGDAGTTVKAPIKNVMSGVVNEFYGFFMRITILVYMAILVFIGLKMILTSTGQGKSSYKSLFLAWVMGVVMLAFFPYVMKYSIKLNNALCEWIRTEQAENSGGRATDGKMSANSVPPPLFQAQKTFGDDSFIMMMLGHDEGINGSEADIKYFRESAIKNNPFGSNVMMEIRFLAGLYLDLPLTIVYFILIGELLAVLIIYYKRVFMVAFLISIFPIVMILYPLNKIGQVRINCFGVWFKEFLVNVFVQSFHAVTYTVIVTVGVNSYLTSKNWLFMIMCILFLFEGEKIIRAIFNAKSSMNTIGDMAAAGIMAMSITKNMTNFIPSFKNGKDSSDDESAADKAKQDRDKVRAAHAAGTDTLGAAANLAAGAGADTGRVPSSSTGGTGVDGNVTLGRSPSTSTTNANQAMNKNIGDRATKGWLGKGSSMVTGALGTVGSVAAQATGASVGLTFGMAQNDSKKGLDAAVAGAVSGMNMGKEVGEAGKGLLTGAAGRVSKAYAGAVVAREYLSGERDDEIDFSGADAMVEQGKQEAIRKAYARIARLKGAGLDNVAEIMLIKERLERDKGN